MCARARSHARYTHTHTHTHTQVKEESARTHTRQPGGRKGFGGRGGADPLAFVCRVHVSSDAYALYGCLTCMPYMCAVYVGEKNKADPLELVCRVHVCGDEDVRYLVHSYARHDSLFDDACVGRKGLCFVSVGHVIIGIIIIIIIECVLLLTIEYVLLLTIECVGHIIIGISLS